MEEVVGKPSKWGKVGKVFLVTTVVVVVAFASFYIWTGIPAAAASYADNRRAAEREGLCLKLADYQKVTTVPESQNGATTILSAAPPNLEPALSWTVTEDLHRHWASFESGLVKLEAARKFPFAAAPRDVTTTFLQTSDFSKCITRWVQDLMIAANESEENGDLAKSAKYYRLAAFLANVSDDDRTYRGTIQRTSTSRTIMRNLRLLIPKRGTQPAWQSMIDRTLHDLDQPFDVRSAVQSSNYQLMAYLDRISTQNEWRRRFGTDSTIDNAFRYGPSLPKFREASLSCLLEYSVEVIRALPKNPWDFVGIEAAFTKADPLYSRPQWPNRYIQYEDIVRLMGTLPADMAAEKNALVQAMAILRHHADPSKGLPLSGRYQMDCDGKPIRLKKLTKGWIVYSVGKNRTDQGGLDDERFDYVVHLSEATVPPKRMLE